MIAVLKIEMPIDAGVFTGEVETIEDVHECTGVGCEGPALCEECDAYAAPDFPVYTWTDSAGISYFACGECLKDDPHARLIKN